MSVLVNQVARIVKSYVMDKGPAMATRVVPRAKRLWIQFQDAFFF